MRILSSITFPEHFILQMNGSNQVVKGFSLIIHHNLFEGACAGGFVNRELLQYTAPITHLRFIHNTIIDNGGIGRIFALHESSSYEARNNLIVCRLEAKDIWGTNIPGSVSHNFFSNVTPRGGNAMTGDPGITLAEGRPLRPPYYTIADPIRSDPTTGAKSRALNESIRHLPNRCVCIAAPWASRTNIPIIPARTTGIIGNSRSPGQMAFVAMNFENRAIAAS